MAYVRWLAAGLGTLLAGAGLLIVWGVAIEPRLVRRRVIDACVPGLPRTWDGAHIALLGDLQVGAPLANRDAVRRAIEQTIRARPAAVLLTGDYVYDLAHAPDQIVADLLDLLAPLARAGIPTWGVLGNHDYAVESAQNPDQQRALAGLVESALEGAGIHVLRNQVAPLPAPRPSATSAEPPLYLVGLGEHHAGEDRWPEAFRDLPPGAPRIVLAHDPAAVERVPGGWAPVALAGHTHGGQIRVPFEPAWTPARWRMPWPEYVDGWIDGFVQPGNHLFVNRGIGFSHLPIRLGAPPELTLIKLRPS